MRLFVLSRHGESVLNNEDRINGDPTVPAPLTEHGRAEAALLGLQVRALPVDACLHTRFDRTLETARIALDGRDVPLVEEELFDDVRVGELEGWTVDEYRAWKREHTRSDRFPGGESLDEAAGRYAQAYRRLLERPYECVLVVCHEIPIRYALNAIGGSDDLDGPVHAIPNATPFLFDEPALAKAAARIERLASGELETRSPR
ncbi:MAG: histidine phosphatase family protein [Actinobacteria bacterium]|nr:MAG: histidine phosphatase family protein [Actinomycetota bacterium]